MGKGETGSEPSVTGAPRTCKRAAGALHGIIGQDRNLKKKKNQLKLMAVLLF